MNGRILVFLLAGEGRTGISKAPRVSLLTWGNLLPILSLTNEFQSKNPRRSAPELTRKREFLRAALYKRFFNLNERFLKNEVNNVRRYYNFGPVRQSDFYFKNYFWF